MSPIEPDQLVAALKAVRKAVATQLRDELIQTYDELAPQDGAPFTINPEVVGRR